MVKMLNDIKAETQELPSQHTTIAWPLSWVYIVLIVYASWYPFSDWGPIDGSSFEFVTLAFPRYWTGFDVLTNILGYVPLGFLLGLSALRLNKNWRGLLWAALFIALLSLAMEWGQNFLPTRIPSNLDWFLNILGGLIGLMIVWQMEVLGAISRWSQFREKWFIKGSARAVALLVLWPVALLFPTPVAFAPGQILERLFNSLSALFYKWGWIHNLDALGDFQIHALSTYSIAFCAFVGLLSPILLGMSVIKGVGRRAFYVFAVLLFGFAISSLSSTMSYGPDYPLVWLTTEVVLAASSALFFSIILLRAQHRTCLIWLVVLLPMMLLIINQAPHDPYFALTLENWERGRFVRFHGLAQYIGWLWPYAVLIFSMRYLIVQTRPLKENVAEN